MEENEKEEKAFRNTINFGEVRNHTISNEKEENRIRSASLKRHYLLEKYIPRPKPVKSKIDPSPINLIVKEEINIDDKNFRIECRKSANDKSLLYKIKSLKSVEGIKINKMNSKDDEYNNKIISNKIYDSSDGESKENENKLITNNENDKKVSKIQKNLSYCINQIRQKMDKIKKKMKLPKFNDDSNVSTFSCAKFFEENFRIKYTQNFINKIKLEKMIEYEKYKNKTISFKDIKSFKPPILEFLQMNEMSVNPALSSCNIPQGKI